MQIGRRQFLKGAALAGAGAMMAGSASLMGCTPAEKTPDAATGAKAGTDEQGIQQRIAQELNPQDFDYRQNTTDLATLFSPLQIGSITIPNRIVKSAAGSGMWGLKQDYAAGLTDPQAAATGCYTRLAKGGVGLIWCENFANILSTYPVAAKADLETYTWLPEFVQAVHDAGAKIGYQFDSMGFSLTQILRDRGDLTDFGAQATCSMISHDEVKALQEDVLNAAIKCKNAGFDGFEINVAGNNIGQSFLCRARNTRDDEYGSQSIENRARFVTELIEQIKEACGKDFIIQILHNGIEENDGQVGDNGGYSTLEECIALAKLFEKAGADCIEVRCGTIANHTTQFMTDLFFTGRGINGTTGTGAQFDFSRHWQGMLSADHSGCGVMLNVARAFKQELTIPVGAVTYMDPAHAPDLFENALKDGWIDYLVMNRALNCDYEYVNKLREGRIDEIAPCNRCLHCYFDTNEEGSTYYWCRMNAATRGAYYKDLLPEGFDPLPAEGDKKVMVIGGGPGGMEAARVAAQRGYDVTLYEKSGLGGLLSFANSVKGPHENLEDAIGYWKRQLELEGVEVVTGQEVDAAFVKEQKPDVAIVATGGLRDTLGMSSTDGTSVVALPDFMTADLGQNVTIVGGNAQAIDCAMYLLEQGKNVTVVTAEAAADLGKGQSRWVRAFEQPVVAARVNRIWDHASLKSVGDGEVTVGGAFGLDVTYPCDSVIEAMDMLPNDELISAIEATGIETHAVGDCVKPYNIVNATRIGNITARNI